jgi:hypothetical protein
MYNYRLSYVSTVAGETHVAVVYADTGIALVAQPAYNIRDLGAGAYLYVTAAMPDGQGGAVAITNGGVLVALAVVSPQETENADEKVSQVAADITAAHGAGLYTGGFPNPPGTHRLSGFEQDAGGNPVDGSVIKATVVSTPQVSTSGIVETGSKITHSNAAGYWYLDLLAGVEYSIDIAAAGVKGKLVQLAADTDFRTLLP